MAGYSVHENCSPQRAGLIEIQGKIVKVYTTAYLSYLGEVTIDASVSLDSSIIINKKYSGHTQGGLNMAASSYMFGETLQKALKSMITQLIADINSIDQGTIEGVREKSPVIQVPNLVESDSDKKTYSGVAANGVVKADGCPAEKNGVSIVSGTRSRTSVSSVLDSIKIPLRSLYYDRF